jgi:hypothetical protein
MARITWFTQPKDKNGEIKKDMYASFYMYDPETLDYVRIRLDLTRQPYGRDDGNPAIVCRKNRIVIVLKDGKENSLKNNDDPKAGGQILDHDMVNNNRNTWHHGDEITYTPYLPDGIKENLEELALKCFNELQKSKNTSYNIPIHLEDKNAKFLSDAINALLKQKSVLPI